MNINKDVSLSILIAFRSFKETIVFVKHLTLKFFTFVLFFCFFCSIKCFLVLMMIVRMLKLQLLAAFLLNLCQFLVIIGNHDYSLFQMSVILFLSFLTFYHFFREIQILDLESVTIVLVVHLHDEYLLHEILHDLWLFYLEFFKASLYFYFLVYHQHLHLIITFLPFFSSFITLLLQNFHLLLPIQFPLQTLFISSINFNL